MNLRKCNKGLIGVNKSNTDKCLCVQSRQCSASHRQGHQPLPWGMLWVSWEGLNAKSHREQQKHRCWCLQMFDFTDFCPLRFFEAQENLSCGSRVWKQRVVALGLLHFCPAPERICQCCCPGNYIYFNFIFLKYLYVFLFFNVLFLYIYIAFIIFILIACEMYNTIWYNDNTLYCILFIFLFIYIDIYIYIYICFCFILIFYIFLFLYIYIKFIIFILI